ncbi:hypothetical protein KOR42_04480 [Thalassoglobus neptunius]|uniref:Uncharacterized protein n=2 Tax=Thalassoglobus neptunius TaxID=1938619 RepID=A0A5C5X2M2_9PLAN|nr:hypothetical protein KOR42_04480 [Thalassoglobus neptunius]
MSDAVDGAVARLDFTPLAHQKVFFDTQFIKDYKGIGFVNSDYMIGSLRQQMVAAGVLLQENASTADFVIEGRVGALGADSHEVVYGIPSTRPLNDAADALAAVSHMPSLPGIPELALAKRSDQVAAAKIAMFAYDKESRERVWQSGMLTSRSSAKDLWVLGAGPFQRGAIHEGKVRFAGTRLDVPAWATDRSGSNGPIASYKGQKIFNLPEQPVPVTPGPEPVEIQQVSAEEEAKEDGKKSKKGK